MACLRRLGLALYGRLVWISVACFAGCGGADSSPIERRPLPVVGYADLHVHQFTNESMAGAWLYGEPTGPLATALPRCSGNVPFAPGRNHGALDAARIFAIGGVLGAALVQAATETMGADTGLHSNRRHGYCQAHNSPGPGLCEGNFACNLVSSANCNSSVCEWRSTGTLCRDKPGDGISVGGLCNLVKLDRCDDVCHWGWGLCRGNLACNAVSHANCDSNVCSVESLGSACRDKDGDGISVGLACNSLGPDKCTNTCTWNPNFGSLTLHPENRAHDWTDRNENDGDKASWPAWDAIAHQQVYVDWLQQAYQDGLRLMVMSALNNEAFCLFLPLANRAPGYGCGDLENVMRQLNAAKALGNDPATPWYRIAYTATEARKLINQNKLAVILSVEASDIFNTSDPVATLQSMYSAGARTLQPLHQFNSKLGGVAWHEDMIKKVQTIKNLPSIHHLCKDAGGSGNYAQCDASTGDLSTGTGSLNYLGLTRAGKRFVTKMLNLGMPVDMAHMSERSIKDVETIVTAACDYPVYISHGHVRKLLAADNWKALSSHEKTVPDWELDLLQRTGGMLGLRTGADYYDPAVYQASVAAAGLTTSIPSRPAVSMNGKTGKREKKGGNEFHFAYALDYASRFKGVHVALGSDLNGLIAQMVFDGEPLDAKMAGLAHIGKLANLFSKLPATGIDASVYDQLRNDSAEAYLRMWERASAFATGTSCCPALSVSQVEPSEAWFGRPNRVTIVGAGFTPHESMQVTVHASASAAEIACTNVEFLSSTELRCTLPVLTANAWYEVTVSNGGCQLEASQANAYHAGLMDPGPLPESMEETFRTADLQTILANENSENGWLTPSPSKNAAVDWSDPAWDGVSVPTELRAADHPIDDGYPQRDWDSFEASPDRLPIDPIAQVALQKEDFAEMTEPTTMVVACDQDEEFKRALASDKGWPADWRSQMDSLCNWQDYSCLEGAFMCPGGATVDRVDEVGEVPTASCPFNVGATVASCPDTDNLALGGLASFSVSDDLPLRVAPLGQAWKAVDGSTDGDPDHGSVAIPTAISPELWWQVDLGSNAHIVAVSLYNRTDCCTESLKQFYVETSEDDVQWTPQWQQESPVGAVAHITFEDEVSARYVRLRFYELADVVGLAEVKVWGFRTLGEPGANIALGKSASTDTGYYECWADYAADGDLGGTTTTDASCTTAISGNTLGAWWQVDLGPGTHPVSAIRIWNRQDCALQGCIDRLQRFFVETSPDAMNWTTQVEHPAPLFTVNQRVETAVFPSTVDTRFVRIKFFPDYQSFVQLNEVEVFGDL